MGYQASTNIVECLYVQSWWLELDVRVKMAKVPETRAGGTEMKTTNLLRELQKLRWDGEVVFHTAGVTEEGPDVGISRVVVENDLENNHRAKQELAWAKHISGNLPSWFFDYWDG